MEKTVICEKNTYQLNLVRRFKKQSDLSLYNHKFDLIYCQWNTRESCVVLNVRFLMFLAVTYQLQSWLCTEHSRVASRVIRGVSRIFKTGGPISLGSLKKVIRFQKGGSNGLMGGGSQVH